MRSFFSKQGLGIGIAAIALLVSCLMPGTEALSHEGALSLGVLAAGVAMWVCKSFPIGITGILILAAGALVGAGSASSVFSGFGSSTTMFMIGVFGLTAVFNKSRLSRRLVGAVS
ncbi:MAG: anion permease, partial [Gordonibacter sp.]|uniref:anion permease n=1 Tax=Gordonibacter sp. TaxID=1968902 RepID=UPI002FC6CE8B